MNKKIITNIFKYARDTEAAVLSLENNSRELSLHYLFPDGASRVFKLPKKLEQDLGESLRQMLKLSPGELINKKYCKLENPSCRLDFLLTIAPAQNGERIIIKVIPKNKRLLSLNQLGLNRNPLKIVRAALKKRSGLILVSSPDNQGKSTTLNALIKEIDKPDISAYLLGPQNEYEFANVNTLASNDNNWDKVLSLDSEVIINEVRTNKELTNVIRAAGSGRLVLAMIKADSVWQALEVYLKSPGSLKLKSKALKLIINQRVAPLKRAVRPVSINKKSPRQAIALFEILELSSEIREFLSNGIKIKNKDSFWADLIKLAKRNNYFPLREDYRHKKENGLI